MRACTSDSPHALIVGFVASLTRPALAGITLMFQVGCEPRALKTTKTKDVRKAPIEPTLMPLLREMHEDSGGEGRVITAMPPAVDWAKKLRKYLARAGIDRADLFANDETRRPLSFHDLRHTGITWRAVRGDEPLKIQRAAGHDDLRTTQRYINEAETFDLAAFGRPSRRSTRGFFGRWRPVRPHRGQLARELARTTCLSHERACFLLRKQRPQGDSNSRLLITKM